MLRVAAARSTFAKKVKKLPNRKNDVNWCMQFIASGIGVVLLVIGVTTSSGFWNNFKSYYLIYFGLFNLIIGFVHRMKWRHKKDLLEADYLKNKWVNERIEDAEAVDDNQR